MKERKQILVVEDNPADSKIVGVYLRQESIKHDFHLCSTLQDAVNKIEIIAPDVIFLDLNLPDSDIISTLDAIVDKFNNYPVIVMTGSIDETLTTRAINQGAQDYLIKGQFNSKRLKTVIEASLGRHKNTQPLKVDSSELKSLTKQLKDIEEMANMGKWSIDLVDSSMVWSDQIYTIFGMTNRMVQPSLKSFVEFIRYEDKERFRQEVRNAEQSSKRVEIEFAIYTNGGTQKKFLKSSFQVSYDKVSKRPLINGFVQDITEQKRSEELLAKQNLMDKSAQINKKILRDLDFQIKTPLASTFSFLNLLMESSDVGENARKDLGSLQGSILELQKAINNMMNFSILNSQDIEMNEKEFKFDTLIENMKTLVNVKRMEKNIDLIIDLPEKNELIPVIGDERKVNQILFNALENAIKYNDENGEVKVSLTQKDVDTEYSNIVVKIEDNGHGISKVHLDELMNSKALFTADDEENKSLGIPIMNKLAEIMDGNIKIESIEEEGTTVEFAIKLKKGTPGQQSNGDKPVSTLRILYVEDHSLMKIATKKTLENWSELVKIDTAGNGQLGVDKYMQEGQYDIILMDLQMPIMDGFEATQVLREVTQVPIIAVTANSDPQERARCIEVGMNDYLSKPFNPDELFSIIMKWINGKSD